MAPSPFNDRRALNLLSRVGDDLAQLRQDISSLISHTAHRTVPDGARQIAESARHHLENSGAYAASRLRALRTAPPKQTLGVAGGLVLAGLIGFGVYALLKSQCSRQRELEDEGGY